MSNAQPHSSAPLPPAPPTSFRPRGCLKFGLIGCGVIALLVIILVIAAVMWWNRNSEQFASGAQEGARFGMVRDEAACFDESKRRAAEASTTAAMVTVGPFLRSCLEYGQPTAGFCDNVPPPTAIGRTAAWQQERCGEDGICRNLLSVVQTYCTEGRPKREAGDTLLMGGEGAGGTGVEVVGENAPPAPAGGDSAAGTF